MTDVIGTIWIEDAGIYGAEWDQEGTIVAQDCANLVITDSVVVGMTVVVLFVTDWIASDAVWASGSQVTVYDSALLGGSGNGSPYGADVDGGDGLELVDGALFAVGATLIGGDGDDETGGVGLRLGPGAQSWLRDTTVTGGAGDTLGQALVTIDTTPTILSGTAPKLSINSPLRFGELVSVNVTGTPGSSVWLLKDLTPFGLLAPQYGGVLLINFVTGHPLPIGAIPGTGQLTLNAIVPALPFFEGIALTTQAALAPPGGGVALSNGSHLLLLDPADVSPAP